MISIKATTDVTATLKQLALLDDKIAKQVIRNSATAGGKVAAKQAQALCPVRDTKAALRAAKIHGKVGRASFSELNEKTGRIVIKNYKGGQLKKSLGYKVKSYPRNKVSVAIVGPRTGFRKQIGVYVKGGKKHPAGEPIIIDPVKYAHLVQLGTRGKKGTDFLTPAGKVGAKVAGTAMSILTDRAIEEASRS